MAIGSTLVNRIDSEGRLTYVDPGWVRLAARVAGRAMTPEDVLGRSFTDFFGGGETPAFLSLAGRRAAEGSRAITVPYHWDSGGVRRWLEAEVVPFGAGGAEFRSRILRESLCLAESEGAPCELDLVTVCGWCRRFRLDGLTWAEVEVALVALGLSRRDKLPCVSHGICPECRDGMVAESTPRAAVSAVMASGGPGEAPGGRGGSNGR